MHGRKGLSEGKATLYPSSSSQGVWPTSQVTGRPREQLLGLRQRPWHSAASVHLGPRCRRERKLPVERGRGMIDGLFCLGPPPGLLSWRTGLEDPRGHKTTGVQRQSQEWGVKVGSGVPVTSWLTLGRNLGPLASVSSSIKKESINPQTVCCLEDPEGTRGRTNYNSSLQRQGQGASQVRRRVR